MGVLMGSEKAYGNFPKLGYPNIDPQYPEFGETSSCSRLVRQMAIGMFCVLVRISL